MPIRFACACGKVFKVGDEHAGKRAKCAACGASNVVPTPDEEIVEAEELDVEVIEDEPEEAAPAKPKPSRGEEYEEEAPRRKKKKRSRDREGPMSRMYAEQARRDMKRDEARARLAGGWDPDDEEGHGWTMFGVHITAGVLSGAGMLIFGLLMMALIAIFKDDEDVVIGPRAFIGAIVFTSLGAIVLVRALFFGEED